MAISLSCPRGQNNLLHTLSTDDHALIAPHLDHVQLSKGTVLEEANTTLDMIYFPVSGLGSTVAVSKSGRRAEVGLFGRDGMESLGKHRPLFAAAFSRFPPMLPLSNRRPVSACRVSKDASPLSPERLRA